MIRGSRALFATALVSLLVAAGCTKSNGPISNSTTPQVNLSIGFSNAVPGVAFAKTVGGGAVDSLRIDSATVVFQRIRFESHIDSVVVDTTGGTEVETETEMSVTFHGPFVIHIRDTSAIGFASQQLPAGTYTGITFKVHRLNPGEHHQDSDEYNGRKHGNLDSLNYGSSLVVWGAVLKAGTWIPFTFKYDGELEFKIKGTFVVPAGGGSIDVSLRFDMNKWFRNPGTGTIIDPTNPMMADMIRQAIRASFEGGHCRREGGHD